MVFSPHLRLEVQKLFWKKPSEEPLPEKDPLTGQLWVHERVREGENFGAQKGDRNRWVCDFSPGSGDVFTNLPLGGGNSNIFGIFTPKFGEMIHFDEHIFQMGWFNHQLVPLLPGWCKA